MHVVRTIGRAFDVCHQRLQQQQQPAKSPVDEAESNGDEIDTAQIEDRQPDAVQPQSKGLQMLQCFCHLLL